LPLSGQIFLEAISMYTVMKAALGYFLIVFPAAFVIGAVRVTMITPHTGPLMAVALEVPIILGLAWIVAGGVLARRTFGGQECLAMGVMAFVLLMVAEMTMAVLLFGQTPRIFLTNITTASGMLGLSGQIGFAFVPLLRHQTRG
jgi:hypothetical protein